MRRLRFFSISVLSLLVADSAIAQDTPVRVPDGFRAELVYSVPRGQGSWVSLANADKGRLIACDQNGNLYRVTFGAAGPTKVAVEKLASPVGRAQGLLLAFGSLYVMGRQGKESGLFRLTDTTGDDQYDKTEQLLSLPVGGEHDGHAIILSPDGKSLYICGGNRSRIPKPGFTSSRMPQTWTGDHLIPRMPDARGHNTGALPIGGWIMRISPDAEERELIANGFRNEYDIAFDAAGELFTYDSDMEWDIGTAWYRPTRVCHAVSGAEFGWRFGTGKWPDYFADSLSSVIDIGPGSPTGIVFGTGAKYPAKYQRALFIADWSYGIIYAVHMTPSGASFTGVKETFATAAPFPVTDMVIRPADGSLYFAVGGRGARSSLHRISYVGTESTAAAAALPKDGRSALRGLRRKLESMHRPADAAVATAWPFLGHSDRHIRFAARLAIENQPVDQWQDRVFTEMHRRAVIHAAVALARRGTKETQARLLDKLATIRWSACSVEEQLELLRAYGLVFSRLGQAGAASRSKLAKALDAHYPADHPHLNRELCRLLSYLDSPSVVDKTLSLQAAASSQEEQMHYAYCLRIVTKGWTTESRRTYLRWFQKATGFYGGASFRGFCKNIRSDAISRIPKSALAALGDLATKEPRVADANPIVTRKFVKNWTMEDLVAAIEKKTSGHDFARGRRMFSEAACMRCHRFAGEGGAVGPDLSAVGGRFGVREILDSILNPSEVISDQYQPTIFELANDKIVVGYVANYNRGTIQVVENMYEPGRFTPVKVADIRSKTPSPISMMPAGLLSTLSLAEVQDLIAYMRSSGRRDHPLFK